MSAAIALPAGRQPAPAEPTHRSPEHPMEGRSRHPGARTVFVSDVHLGTRGCKAEALLAFLERTPCETLYLVGDIVDGWRLTRAWYWQASHSAVIQKILALAKGGTRVVYIPGNHDEALRPYAGLDLAGIEVRHEVIHQTADGRAFLVVHGDFVDGAVRYAAWLAHLGDWAYDGGLWLSETISAVRRRLGLAPWSLALYVKRSLKSAVAYIARYEEAIARETRARGLDGAICGHIHHVAIRRIGPTLYCNDGDWVESCTALVERHDGSLAVVDAEGTVLVQERPTLAKAFA